MVDRPNIESVANGVANSINVTETVVLLRIIALDYRSLQQFFREVALEPHDQVHDKVYSLLKRLALSLFVFLAAL